MSLPAPPSFASQCSGMRKAKENKLNVHSGIHPSLCDITAAFLVFVFLKIVVKATLETAPVATETALVLLSPPRLGERCFRVTPGHVDLHVFL